jgi:phage terminase large subunit-like protein
MVHAFQTYVSETATIETPKKRGRGAPKGSRADHWDQEFHDIPQPDGLGNVYYKSECRPLKHLKPIHRQGVVGRWHKLGFRDWLDERDRARKDLYWLGKTCIGTPESGSGFVEHVHREMCEMFVQKNFDGVYHEGWTLDEARAHFNTLKREKEALILTPTGSFKSTVDKIDCVQWMLNFPDVRIFIITGSGALSRKFLKEVKGFFYKPEGQKMTRFQGLFPEYVIEGNDGDTMAPMFSPARIHAQPGTPTLWVNSIDGTIAGWHCDVWKGDDIVNEDNSNSEDTRDTLKNRYDNLMSNRPDAWAFKDHIGTRYDPDDWYGTRIEEAKKYADTNALKYICRSAWKVKAGFETVPIKKLQEHMVELYFPEFMPFRALITQCRQNEKNFRCQKLNEPAGGDVAVNFDEETIRAHTILLNGVPRVQGKPRRPAIVWDTAHGDKVQSDYSAGAVGWCDGDTRTLYVLEICHGKWVDSKVAIELVELHWKWDATFSEVEKFHGWELLAREIQRYSLHKYGKPVPLLWREADTSSGSKRNWVKGLETLLANDRLFFVDGDWMERLIEQFCQFTGFSKRRKDDIPDAISKLQRLIPREPLPDELRAVETQDERKAREAQELRDKFAAQQGDAAYGTIFGSRPAPQPIAVAPEPAAVDRGPGWMFGNSGIHL